MTLYFWKNKYYYYFVGENNSLLKIYHKVYTHEKSFTI